MYSLAQTFKFIFSNEKTYGVIEKNRDTITKLKFITTLQSGQKIDVKNLQIETNNLFTPLKRMIYGESRETTINFFNTVIERSFEIIQAYCNSEKKSEQIFCSNIIFDLAKSIYGLQNIQKTYKEDNLFVCNIDTLIENITGKLMELKEKYPKLFREVNNQEIVDIKDNKDELKDETTNDEKKKKK
jgi:hypothetical protein